MLQYRKLKELKKLPNNPRTISEDDFDRLITSIRDNGFLEARPLILSNRTGDLVILGGNQRYEAAKKLQMNQVPTFLMEGLTEDKEKEIIIRDNVNNGEWDWDVLANEYNEDELSNWGVDVPYFDPEMSIEGDSNTPAVNLVFLSFGKCKIPITEEDLADLTEQLNLYVDNHTVSIGFGNHIVKALKSLNDVSND